MNNLSLVIEVKNFDSSQSKNTFKGTFDVIIRNFMNQQIRFCKLFEKENKRWIRFPERSTKNIDGTWGSPESYVIFPPEEEKKLQLLILDQLKKILNTSSADQNEITTYPHGLIKPGQSSKVKDDLPF